ncbi:TRAP transporter small permease [Propionivibrio dicarboxylicus]|uniref:TRAP transporter small permease protein n=1 Tax=Propionivibrio dicarboxylicus TaxID=83767 RepID=A0A1G7WL31_9RHOO|nr:TRAP transporter small permease [Propionivibrio dicarboxylicus]SDG72578.1 TRAP-type C4-dicarboxylate transport system, small permease component [Propionivibrio dicarboxylicus]
MHWLTKLNEYLSRWAMYIAVASLLGIVGTVLGSVIWRYVLNNAPSWSEQVALLLVINVAMFGAAAGIRDEGHIGMESLVGLLPKPLQFWVGNMNGYLTILFGAALIWCGTLMAISVYPNRITSIGITEAWRYVPCIIAGTLFILFSIEHLIAMFTGKEVTPSWH